VIGHAPTGLPQVRRFENWSTAFLREHADEVRAELERRNPMYVLSGDGSVTRLAVTRNPNHPVTP
jgi:hypothetical protein